MEVSVENAGGLERRMTVQVPAERVEDAVRSRLQSMVRTVRVAGFRPGKVPLRVVEQKYGRQVRLEVIDQLVNSTMQEAIAQNSLRPVGNPSIEPSIPAPGQPLRYVATFEVFPEFQGDIDCGFTVERPVVEITDADVDAMMETLRSQRADWQTVGRPAGSGDQVTIDFTGTIDGREFGGGSATNVPLVLGSGKMIPGFEEQLEGASAGESRTLQVTFPADYPSAELAGREARFSVRVNAVAETVLPPLDDEFAVSFGAGARGIAGLREDVEANMRRELAGMIASKLKTQVFDGLLDRNPVEVPKSIVANEIEELKRLQGGKPAADADLEERAARRVRLGMLVSELARRNNIQLDVDRVRRMVETIASSYEKPEEVAQWYYGNRDMMANVQSAIMEELVVEWVTQHGGVALTDRNMTFNELVDEARNSQVKG